MMGTEIFKIDASWAEKLTKTRVSFLMTPTVANGPSLSLNMMENGNNSTQSVKADYEKGGSNMN